jgi:hypothetical protein
MMPLDPDTVRQDPQLAALELLVQAAEVGIIVLCAAHPNIERDPSECRPIPIDQLANRVVHIATSLLDTIDHYRLLLHDLARLRRGTLLEDDLDF